MADWNFDPPYPYRSRVEVAKMLANELEDFSEIRDPKGSDNAGTYREPHSMVTSAELASMMAFFYSKGLDTSFTKRTFDPSSVGYDSTDVLSATGPVETVRFLKEPTWTHTGPDTFNVIFDFKRLRGE